MAMPPSHPLLRCSKVRLSSGWFEHELHCRTVASGGLSRGVMVAGEGVECEELEFQTVYSGLLTVNRTRDGLYHLGAPLAAPTDAVPECAQPGSPLLTVRAACILHACARMHN